MGIQFRKAKVSLGFKEGKPQVYKLKQLTYPIVTFKELIDECSQSCGVNPAHTHAVIYALTNRLTHYMEIGHGVNMGDFGSFKPVINVKTVKKLDDLEGEKAMDTVTLKKVRFYPGKSFRDMLSELDVTAAAKALDVQE